MQQLFELTCNFLERQCIAFQHDGSQILIEQKSDIASWKNLFVFHPYVPQVALYGYFPFQTPEDRRPHAMELLHRCNSGLILGNFEYNFETHEIRFKSSVDLHGQQASYVFLHTLMKNNLVTMEEYFTPMLGCLIYHMSIEDALHLQGKRPNAIPQNRKM